MENLVGLRRLAEEAPMEGVLALIRESFAYMDGRIDPPSSMHRLTAADLAQSAGSGEVWILGPPDAPLACVVMTPKPDALYLGKLAVSAAARGQGLSRKLIDCALGRARARGLPCLELQSRVELVENHAAFRAMGFVVVAATTHPGYDRPTSLTFRRPLG